jgi:ubiquinol-cytochrome c reductase cytochrome b subunit
VGITVFLFVFCFVIFFMPEMGGFFLEYANFELANGLKTPPHIAPVWYFTPFYAILRAVTIDIGPLSSKFLGLVAMGGAVAILFVLPWLDKSPVKSMRYKGWMPRLHLMLFAAMFVVLGYLGVQSPTPGRTILAQLATVYYFAFFLQMPNYTNPLKKSGLVSIVISVVLAAMMLNLAVGAGADVPLFIKIFGVLLALFVVATPFLTNKDGVSPEPERLQTKGLPAVLVWGGFILFLILTIVPIKAVASASAFECGAIPCDHMEPDLEDKESLQNGAKWFANYCMGCHSAQYSRFERVADDLGIPHDVMMENMVFGDQKIGDLMTIPMQPQQSKAWFGATPPDLTLVARARSPEWLYTYLRSFYKDESRPTGVNNKVFDKVAMPHAMLELQGLQECAPGPVLDHHGHIKRDTVTGAPIADAPCGSLKVGAVKGSMSEEEFDKTVYDLVNFLEYLGEPVALERESLGVKVLLFLVVLFVFVTLLNREYWRDIH